MDPYNYPRLYPQLYGQQVQPIQPIQTIQQQAQCSFVTSVDDMAKFQVQPNVSSIGINPVAKEIYVRKMNNDGNIELESYCLKSEKKELSEMQAVVEKLDSIAKQLAEISKPKGEPNEHIAATVNE